MLIMFVIVSDLFLRTVAAIAKVVFRIAAVLFSAAGITPYSVGRALRALFRGQRWVALLLVLAGLQAAAMGQIIVEDPDNLRQSLQQSLDQLAQLKAQLQAQQQMLAQLTGGLSLQSVAGLLAETQTAVQQMSRVIDSGSAALNSGTLTPAQISQSYTAIGASAQQAAAVQARIISNQPAIAGEVQSAGVASQMATGQTAATQASNQLLVALSQQMADIQTSLVTLNQILAQRQQQDAAAATAGQQSRQAPLSLPTPQNWSDLYVSH